MDNLRPTGNDRSFSDKNWSEYSNREKVGVVAGVVFIGLPYSIFYKTPCKILKWTWNTALPKAGEAIEYVAKKILMPTLIFIWQKTIAPIGKGLRKVTFFTGKQLFRCMRAVYQISSKILSMGWHQIVKPLGRTFYAVLKTVGENVSHVFQQYIYPLILAPLGRRMKKILVWTWDRACTILAGIRDCVHAILRRIHRNVFVPLGNLLSKVVALAGNFISSIYKKAANLFRTIFAKLYQYVLAPLGRGLKTIALWTKNAMAKGWNLITTIVGQAFRFLQKYVYYDFVRPIAIGTWRVLYDYLLLPICQLAKKIFVFAWNHFCSLVQFAWKKICAAGIWIHASTISPTWKWMVRRWDGLATGMIYPSIQKASELFDKIMKMIVAMHVQAMAFKEEAGKGMAAFYKYYFGSTDGPDAKTA